MFLMMACDLRQGLSSARDRRCLFGEVWWKQPPVAEGNTTAHSCEGTVQSTRNLIIANKNIFQLQVSHRMPCTMWYRGLPRFCWPSRYSHVDSEAVPYPTKLHQTILPLAPDILANASGSSWLLSGPRYNSQHPVQAAKHSQHPILR